MPLILSATAFKKCHRIHFLCCLFLFSSINLSAQLRWDGEAGDGLWSTATNWTGNTVPAATDDVLLDNSFVTADYTVLLPSSAVIVRTLSITPLTSHSIQLMLPATNTFVPAFTAMGPGYGITINNGGIFMNASGSSSGSALLVQDSLRINNGGQYIHHTRSAHAAMVTTLSNQPGTETGIFTFDVPGGGYTIASTKRTYGSLVLGSEASGGIQAYATTAASPLIINGDLVIKDGVNFNLNLTAATTINGNLVQEGGVFNLASQANNNVVYIKGNCFQTNGVITETSGGSPVLEFNGTTQQDVRLNGITNNVAVTINNNAGISLLSGLSLPYRLSLINGTVNNHSFIITLQAGCSLQADSLPGNNFINGALRKEGLTNAVHFLFPIGKGNTKRWIAVKTTSGNYTAEFFRSNPKILATAVGKGIDHISSIEHWSLQSDTDPAPEAKVELSFDNVNSGGVTDMAALRVAQLVSGVWENGDNIATTGSAGAAGSVVSKLITVVDTLGYFTLGSNIALQNPLPIQLLSFTASAGNKGVLLSWTISPSWQPAFFEVQSSADSNHFEIISRLDTVTGRTMYQYADSRKLTGKQYYRLQMIDKNGLISYSNAIGVMISPAIDTRAGIWPSIVNNNAVLFLDVRTSGKSKMNICNMQGGLVQSMDLSLHAGKNYISLQLSGLPAGVYVLSIIGSGNIPVHIQFIKTSR